MAMQMSNNKGHLFPYEWRLSDGYPAKGIEPNGCKVFGTFICGGGSSMGYKLAGYTHLGGVELDPKIAAIYKENHHPKYLYNMDIRDFNKLQDLPDELYDLDILDGSPPCSTFSMAGDREKAWGKSKQFAEGQKKQRLDDLVFVYCDTIAKLHPKVCWLENVSGLVKGNAKVYAKAIKRRIEAIGYNVQLFLLNAATMGVPQRRERCFFIGLRKDYHLPKLRLDFNEPPIPFRMIKDGLGEPITGEDAIFLWKNRQPADGNLGDTNKRVRGKVSRFNEAYIFDNKVLPTLPTVRAYLYSEPKVLSDTERIKGSTFPMDYVAPDGKLLFLTGMSVPPVMSAQISHQIWVQWLSKIKK